MVNLILSKLHEAGHTAPPKQKALCLEVIAVSCLLTEESKMKVHTCTCMCMLTRMHYVYGERGRE